MNTTISVPSSHEARADVDAVAAAVAAGEKPAPDVVRRIRERSALARKELLASHGVQDVGVPIIRELRGELPT